MAKKPKTDKGIDTASFGVNVNSGNAASIATIKAIDKSLSPQEAYQLSIDVQSAVKAIVTNAVKAKLRLFSRRSGEEIISGDLYDLLRRPAPGWSTVSMLTELISWYLLSGEMAANAIPGGTGVAGFLPLNPFRLAVQSPAVPNDKSEVTKWRYIYPNGTTVYIDPKYLMHEKNFNPFSMVRGLSPLLAGVNEISASYQATAYNRRFFVNDCVPSHILVLPPGTDPKDREALKNEYIASHSTFGGNNNKVWVVEGGKGLDIKTLESTPKDAQFLNLQKMTSSDVMQLYKVPPVHGGQWDQTKFDSVDVQNEVFAESTLLPVMELTSCFLQTQLVDRFYSLSSYGKSQNKPHIGKAFAPIFERAREVRVESDIIVLLDPDSLPIVAKLKQSRLGYAKDLQATFKITPAQAAVECGFEFDETEANTAVWVASNEIPIDPDEPIDFGAFGAGPGTNTAPEGEPDAPETNPDDSDPVEPPEADDSSEDQTAEGMEETAEDEAEKAVRFRDFYRAFRKLALDAVDAGKMPRLIDADELNKTFTNGSKTLAKEIRRDYAALYSLVKDNADKETAKRLVKDYLNKKNRQYLRALARKAA